MKITTRAMAKRRHEAKTLKAVRLERAKARKRKKKSKKPAKKVLNPSRKHQLALLRKIRWAYDEDVTPAYVVTDRAGKNVGDHLLHKRAVQVLRRCKGLTKKDRTIAVYGARKVPLKLVNKARALIICGGPALGEKFHPKLYPLADNLNDIKVPIFLFGVGGGYRIFKKDDLKLNKSSQVVLRNIVDNGGAIGVRDEITSYMLNKYGIDNEVIGCPAYFHPNWDTQTHYPKKVRSVLFTTGMIPGNKELERHHRMLLGNLIRSFPKVTIGYHRGQKGDLKAPKKAKIINTTRNLPMMEKKYGSYDMHVGYRVHAHIWFLSQGKPSFLVPIDMRGLGAARFSNTPYDKTWKTLPPNLLVSMIRKEVGRWPSFKKWPSRLMEIRKMLGDFVAKIPGGK